MQTAIVVPNHQPYLEFMQDMWEIQDLPWNELNEAYFEQELKPICQDIGRAVVLRRVAFDKAFDHRLTPAMEAGLTQWTNQEINVLPDAERPEDYELWDLCSKVSYFAVKNLTFEHFITFLNNYYVESPMQ